MNGEWSEGRFFICWFTTQMAAMAGMGPGKPRARILLPVFHVDVGAQALVAALLPFTSALAERWIRNELAVIIRVYMGCKYLWQ